MFQEVEAPRVQDKLHMKEIRLSALRTGRLYSSGNIPGTHFCQRLSRPPPTPGCHKIVNEINSNYTIGDLTRNLPACSAVPHSNTPPRVEHTSYVDISTAMYTHTHTHTLFALVSPKHRPPLPIRKYSWYSFLSEVESTPQGGIGLCQ